MRRESALQELWEQAAHVPARASQVVLDMGMVALAWKDQQVGRVIVAAVPIAVMDDLPWEQWPTQLFGSHLTVDQKQLAGVGTSGFGIRLLALHGLLQNRELYQHSVTFLNLKRNNIFIFSRTWILDVW